MDDATTAVITSTGKPLSLRRALSGGGRLRDDPECGRVLWWWWLVAVGLGEDAQQADQVNLDELARAVVPGTFISAPLRLLCMYRTDVVQIPKYLPGGFFLSFFLFFVFGG